MKSNPRNSWIIASLAAITMAGMTAAHAGNGTWLDGGGTWNDETKWLDNLIADGEGAMATFGKPTTSSTITLTENVTIGSLFLAGAWTPNLTSYTLDGTGSLIMNNGDEVATITMPTVGASGTALTINTALEGTKGLKLVGSASGFTYLMLNHSTIGLTGGVEITNGLRLFLGSSTALGSNTVTTSGTNNAIFFGTTAAISGNVSNHFVLNSTTATTLGYGVAGTNIGLSGEISETGGSRSLIYAGNTGSGVVGRIAISGDNSYTGNTTISNVRVRAMSNNAFGTGNAEVIIYSSAPTRTALEMEGGITISDKKLTLGGTGNANTGTLVSIDGDNTWAGDVVLGNSAEGRIGVLNDSLTIDGEVSSTTGTILTKVGDGALRLEGANTYTTGTKISEGILIAANAQALGTGGVTIENGAALQIDAGIKTTVSSLSLEENARLIFNLNESVDATGLVVLGDQTGSITYTIDVLSAIAPEEGTRTYTLLEVQGTSNAAGFILGEVPELWNAELQWVDQTLRLNVTAIPEPGTVTLLSSAVAYALLMTGRKLRRSSKD